MRGTNYKVGFGIASFFFITGSALYLAGSRGLFDFGPELEGAEGTANGVFKLMGGIWAGVGGCLLLLFVLLWGAAATKRSVVANGIEGTAVVLKADTTNIQINGMPQYRLEVDLQPGDGGPSRRCTKRDIVPYTVVGRWGIGTALPVRISRRDPDEFVILWEDLPPPASNADVADELSKLADLAQRGLLSPEEWERAKQLYLGKPVNRRDADTRLLRELNDLFRNGVLSESEFNDKKWEILSRT